LKFHGPHLDFTEGQGLIAQYVGIFQCKIIFQWENTVDSVHHLWTIEGAGPWWTGPWPAEGDSLELGLAAALGHDGSLVVAQ
jgi:hypothetical protein